MKSPTVIVGLLVCGSLLLGCQATSPEQVTAKFWQALAQSQIEIAKTQATQESQNLVNLGDIDKHSSVKTGEVILDEPNASVETIISRNNRTITFNTVLFKEKDNWKVDFQQTHSNIAMIPFEGIAKSLRQLGDTFTNQLEQSVPLIEKEIESLGNELKNQIEEFGQSLKKPGNSTKQPSHTGSI